MPEPETKPVSAFLKHFGSTSTQQAYTSALRRFFTHIDPNDERSLDAQASEYLAAPRDHRKDIEAYAASLQQITPKTWNMYLNALRSFLRRNNTEFDTYFWRDLRLLKKGAKGNYARTRDKAPTNNQLRQLIGYMPLHGKTLYTLLATSGIRIGEALQLTLQDLDLKSDPDIVRIDVPGEITKNGDPRVTFATTETKEFLQAWLSHRD